MRSFLKIGLLLLLGFGTGCQSPRHANVFDHASVFDHANVFDHASVSTLVLRNGKIITVDDRFPQVQALAIRGDRILAVGSDAAILRYIGPNTRVIDLKGKLAVPGFIEGHGHFTSVGSSKLRLDLMRVKNWDEVIAMVKEAVAKAEPGE